jgi:hypothetical protein
MMEDCVYTLDVHTDKGITGIGEYECSGAVTDGDVSQEELRHFARRSY